MIPRADAFYVLYIMEEGLTSSSLSMFAIACI